MKYTHVELKEHLISLIKSLPDDMFDEYNDKTNEITVKSIKNFKEISNMALLKYEAEIHTLGNKFIIGLIGNVNAGKSSLGNLLLNKAPSEVFKENEVRETSIGKLVEWQENWLLDLPGLGFNENDDRKVRDYIRRANILILVMGINSVLDEHQYNFIKDEIATNGNSTQRVFIVLNKTDIYEDYSTEDFEIEVNKITNYILNGDPNSKFTGISNLFPLYKIKVLPFSVRNARENPDLKSDILKTIQDLKATTKVNYDDIYFKELSLKFNEFSFIEKKYAELEKLINTKKNEVSEAWNKSQLQTNGNKLARINIHSLRDEFSKSPDSLYYEMDKLPKPNFLEKSYKYAFGEGDKFKAKKNAFGSSLSKKMDTMTRTYKAKKDVLLANFYRDIIKSIWGVDLKNDDIIGEQVLQAFHLRLREVYNYFISKYFDGENVSYYRVSYDSQLSSKLEEYIKTHSISINSKIEQAKSEKLKKIEPLEKQKSTILKAYENYKKIKEMVNLTVTPPPQKPITKAPPKDIGDKQGDNNFGEFLLVLFVVVFVMCVYVIFKK
jgi:GTP-binding protein EngB required for normal cell division